MGCEELVEHVRCVCVWLGAAWVERGGEWIRGLGLGFTNPMGTGVVLDVCLCFGRGWGLGPGSGGGGVVLCLSVVSLESLCR